MGTAGAQYVYTNITQSATSSANGALSVAKGGATGSTTVNSPSSGY
ncbi:MAG: hypothetical protein JO036_21200 [Candidatus Eremiobacteraeota bacterium]|nr:hypothetical protein [Candidatus Eremiobacteraeota bacterium]